MALRRLWALALSIQCINAFKDTSPFFLFSTSRLLTPDLERTHLITSSSLDSTLSSSLASCPSETYIVVSQPGVSAIDYSGRLSNPNLRQWLNKTGGGIESTVTVEEVVGTLDAGAIERALEERCKAEVLRIDASTGTIPNDGNYPRIVKVDFPALPTTLNERVAKMAEHDSFLHAVISELGGDKYTVVYTTSPPSIDHLPASLHRAPPAYEMEDPFASVLHTDLKRDLESYTLQSNSSKLPLFDTYEFLSPGIFMGLMVFILLFLILYVGITAVASLQVSYFAFSKEMGPSQQKKQQ